jgi:hypothetical protein
VEADIVTGGGLFPLKGLMPDLCTRKCRYGLGRSVRRFCRSEHRISTAFTPERLVIEKVDGTVVAEWLYPKNNSSATA